MCALHAGQLGFVDWLNVDAAVNVFVFPAFESGWFDLEAFSEDCEESDAD
jgi:hypothetical protein